MRLEILGAIRGGTHPRSVIHTTKWIDLAALNGPGICDLKPGRRRRFLRRNLSLRELAA